MRVAHDTKDAIQLVVMIGTTRLHVLLTTVEYGFKGQQLGKDTANGPNICKKERETSYLARKDSAYFVWLWHYPLCNFIKRLKLRSCSFSSNVLHSLDFSYISRGCLICEQSISEANLAQFCMLTMLSILNH